ncbi:MAG: hypothetical protein Q9214_006834 [Letrouitia sp. 1 TL-2023]
MSPLRLRRKSDFKRSGRRPLDPSKDQAQPRGVDRKRLIAPVRKSARLQKRRRLQKSETQLIQLPSPTSITPDEECPQKPVKSFNPGRKRKRSEELGQNHNTEAKRAALTPPQSQEKPVQKRQQTTPSNSAVKGAARTNIPDNTEDPNLNPIQRWVEEGSWSGGNFDQDSNMAHSLTRKSLNRTYERPQRIRLFAKNYSRRNSQFQKILCLTMIYLNSLVKT